MPYGWTEHTGELELWVRAAREEDVFAEALNALAEALGEEDAAAAGTRRREVRVSAPDRPALFAAWLEELAFLAETDGFVADGVEQLALAPAEVRARVAGHHGTPPHLVKAVTYHRLVFERDGHGWRAAAVLDV